MDATRFRESLGRLLPPGAVKEDESLARHTTFQVGGPADWLVTVESVDVLRNVLAAAREASIPVTLLGGGSNVVVADAGIPGAVIRMHLTGLSQPAPDRVRAEAGVTMNGLVRWMIGRGLSGLEAWAGTPGTIGGAIYGNAHYAGRNIGDLVDRVQLAGRDGTLSEASRMEMGFAYDTSRLQHSGEILVWADFICGTQQPELLRTVARASLAHRKQTQPLALPSAGCLFQNPERIRDRVPEGIPASAGALIDRAGLKGFRVGGAMISPVHGNFVVSDGTATARDIRTLAETVRQTVKEKLGVVLRDEVVYLGRF